MSDYQSHWYESSDGLKLYSRDYSEGAAPFTVLCMHGLTRNSADFEGLIEHLRPHYPLLVVDQRGRGQSAYDPDPSRYQVPVYAADMFTLLDNRGITDVVLIGTSMGGLIAMQMLAMRPEMIRGVILNDIGAVIEGEGLTRIQGYVGKSTKPASNWQQAADQTKAVNGDAFPDYSNTDWLRFAHRLYRENSQGLPELAYDPAISQTPPAGDGSAVSVELWPLFDALAAVPMLIVRGAHSDILSAQCVAEMLRRKPGAKAVEISNRGHAPMLDEPQAVAAIKNFLESLG